MQYSIEESAPLNNFQLLDLVPINQKTQNFQQMYDNLLKNNAELHRLINKFRVRYTKYRQKNPFPKIFDHTKTKSCQKQQVKKEKKEIKSLNREFLKLKQINLSNQMNQVFSLPLQKIKNDGIKETQNNKLLQESNYLINKYIQKNIYIQNNRLQKSSMRRNYNLNSLNQKKIMILQQLFISGNTTSQKVSIMQTPKQPDHIYQILPNIRAEKIKTNYTRQNVNNNYSVINTHDLRTTSLQSEIMGNTFSIKIQKLR